MDVVGLTACYLSHNGAPCGLEYAFITTSNEAHIMAMLCKGIIVSTVPRTNSSYACFADGVKVEWGTYIGQMNDDDSVIITFPLSFTVRPHVLITPLDNDNNGVKSLFIYGKSDDTTVHGIYTTSFRTCNTQNQIRGPCWLATGY